MEQSLSLSSYPTLQGYFGYKMVVEKCEREEFVSSLNLLAG